MRRSWLRIPFDFLRAPAVDGEHALLALFNIAAVVLVAGVLWQRDLRATLVIAGVIGLATRALDPAWLGISWRPLAGLLGWLMRPTRSVL